MLPASIDKRCLFHKDPFGAAGSGSLICSSTWVQNQHSSHFSPSHNLAELNTVYNPEHVALKGVFDAFLRLGVGNTDRHGIEMRAHAVHAKANHCPISAISFPHQLNAASKWPWACHPQFFARTMLRRRCGVVRLMNRTPSPN